MRYVVRMGSDEYGNDYFYYDSRAEALEGMGRLHAKAAEYYEKDGVVRDIAYLGEEDEEEEDE